MRSALEDYIFHKQTFKEITQTRDFDRRKIQKLINAFSPKEKLHAPRPLHLIVDATYFGERKDDSAWCVLVGRYPLQKENLSWRFEYTETTYGYALLREELERLGYTILSVTSFLQKKPRQMKDENLLHFYYRTRNLRTESRFFR